MPTATHLLIPVQDSLAPVTPVVTLVPSVSKPVVVIMKPFVNKNPHLYFYPKPFDPDRPDYLEASQQQNEWEFSLPQFQKIQKEAKKIYQPVFIETHANRAKPKLVNPIELPNHQFNNFSFIMLLICLALTAYAVQSIGKYIDQMLLSPFKYQAVNRLYQLRNAYFEKISSLLNYLFIITASLFFVAVLRYFNLKPDYISEFQLFAFCVMFILLFYAFKLIANQLVSWLFNKRNAMKEYNYNIFLSFKILGLLMIPITMAIIYLPEKYKAYALYAGIFIIIIQYVVLIIRALRIILIKEFLLFYTLLYLCTVEILPVVLIIKFSLNTYS